MPVVNAEIASVLDKIADLLGIEGAIPFASARTGAPRGISDRLAAGEDLDEPPGIGEDLAETFATIARGQHLALLEDLEREAPTGITALLTLPGAGPQRVHGLPEALGSDTTDKVVAVARAAKIASVPGFGPEVTPEVEAKRMGRRR